MLTQRTSRTARRRVAPKRLQGLKTVLPAAVLLAGLATSACAQSVIYDNTTNFLGQAFRNGGATDASQITNLVADDINFAAGSGGQMITGFKFSVANLDTASVSARARLRFYQTDGANGGPGTVIAGFTFNPIAFGTGVTTFSSGGGFIVPTNEKIWAGITFDNAGVTATTTTANLNNLGQGIFDPPTVGSSSDTYFRTSTNGSFLSSNPPGSFGNFGGAPVANFGWQFSVAATPEPSSPAVLGVGVLGLGLLAVRRRGRRASASSAA